MYLDVTSRSKWVGEADYDLVALPSRSTEAWGQRLPRTVISCSAGTVCYHRQGPAFVQGPCEPGGDRFMEQHEELEKLVLVIFCCQAPESKRGSLFSELLSRLKLRFNETNLLIKCCSGA